MQFNSVEFIFYFLPAFLAVYHLCRGKAQSAVLAVGSFLFYGFAVEWNGLAIALLAGCMLLGYLGGLTVDRWRRLPVLLPMCLLYGGALVFFKLYVGGGLLPVGMSFYVFQLIAYLADIYRGKIPAEKNPVRFLAQMTMFPRLLSGPIADTRELARDNRRPHRKLFTFHLGLQEFILGLGLKVILANRLGGLWEQGTIVGFETVSTPYMWLALLTFCMRLYFDFYGYSLMAVGLGHMLGYNLPMNFLEPYSSKSVSEFYRRWHATLGRWFRDYIYIPMGGSHGRTARTLLNLAVVWAVTGFWHGVGGGYMLWAGILLFFVILERLWLKKYLDKSKFASHLYLISVIILSWVPFAASGIGESLVVYRRLFGIGGIGPTEDFAYWVPIYARLVGLGLLFATPIPAKIWRQVQKKPLADVALFILFWVCLYFIATSAQDPFIYFDF